MSQHVWIRRALVMKLIECGLIRYIEGDRYARWFGTIVYFSKGQRACWQAFWRNLLNGNTPLSHERVLSAWNGESSQLSDLFKRHPAWKTIIVGNGRGHFWLHIPPEVISDLESNNTPQAGE